MADRIRYVNTASTAGGTGLTNATTGVDRAYTTMSECEAAEQDDFVLAGDRLIIYAGGYESGATTVFTFDGSITSATNNITILGSLAYTAESGQTYGPTARVNDQFVHLTGLKIRNTTDTNGRCIDFDTGYSGSSLIGCILDKTTVTATPGGFAPALYINQPQGDISVVNNLIFGHMTAGISTFSTADSACNQQVYNNTIISKAGSYGIDMVAQPSQSIRLFNNIVQMLGGGTAYRASTWAASGSNISGDATSPDGASFQNIALTFVDAANDDYHLAAVDTAAIDTGLDLSTDTQYPFADDSEGTVRPQSTGWDIGAFEYIQAGPVTLSLIGGLQSEGGGLQGSLSSFSVLTLTGVLQSEGYSISGFISLSAIVNISGGLIAESGGVIGNIAIANIHDQSVVHAGMHKSQVIMGNRESVAHLGFRKSIVRI